MSLSNTDVSSEEENQDHVQVVEIITEQRLSSVKSVPNNNRDSIMMAGMEEVDTPFTVKSTQHSSPGDLHLIKKRVTEGMMDIALLTANANQLKFIITYNKKSATYYLTVAMVVLSLVLQILVGIVLIIRRYMKVKGSTEHIQKCNVFLVVGIFVVTILNILAACFTTTDVDVGPITKPD